MCNRLVSDSEPAGQGQYTIPTSKRSNDQGQYRTENLFYINPTENLSNRIYPRTSLRAGLRIFAEWYAGFYKQNK